jgi:chemotaxis protein CheX
MKVAFVNPFIDAAREVLESELGGDTNRGDLRMHKSAYTTDEVTALVGVAGAVSGVVLYSMSEETARNMVARMLGKDCPEFDAMAQSGIGELGNVITGRAAALLALAGYASNITPPALVMGKNTMITTLDLNRLVFPLETEAGTMEIQVVLSETTGKSRPPA